MVANDILVTRDNIQLNTGLVMIKHAHVLYERKEYVTPAIRHSQRERERARPNGGSRYVCNSHGVAISEKASDMAELTSESASLVRASNGIERQSALSVESHVIRTTDHD